MFVFGFLLAFLPLVCVAENSKVIAVDVGHFKARPGATSAHGRPEFEFNAALAEVIGADLSAHGAAIVPIGMAGDMAELTKRTQLANAAKAALFLSVHHDSVQAQFLKPWQFQGKDLKHSDYASGFSLFVSRKNPDLATSLKCASAMGKALKAQGFHASQHHAEAIEGENKAWADQDNGVFFYDNLVVLKTAAMPAVLLEAGVIANRLDEENVQKPETQKQIATAVRQGLQSCGVLSK